MYTYLVKFSVNGTRTEQIVKANSNELKYNKKRGVNYYVENYESC